MKNNTLFAGVAVYLRIMYIILCTVLPVRAHIYTHICMEVRAGGHYTRIIYVLHGRRQSRFTAKTHITLQVHT